MRKETAEWILGCRLRDGVSPLWAVVSFGLLMLATLAGFVLVVSMAFWAERVTKTRERSRFEREAVQHGAAEWDFDADGQRVFRWKGEADDAE